MSKVKKQDVSLIGINSEPLQSRVGSYKFKKSDWSTLTFVIPRSLLSLTFSNKELQYNCIYFLYGYEESTEKVYIGQAKKRNGGGSVLARLREHDKNVNEPYYNIWQYAIIVTNINDDWGPTELSNLEHLICKEINPKHLCNGNIPNFAVANNNIDYPEKIRQIKTYLKVVGLHIFDDEEEIDEPQLTPVKNEYYTVEDLQGGMALIPEIVTPQKIVKQMIELLPTELFNPDTTFLDLACKGGEYLRGLYDRLMETESLVAKYSDPVERSNHILDKQLFGIALSQMSFDRTTKSLKGFSHNIKIVKYYINYIKLKKEDLVSFTNMIKGEFGHMKFDVIIGNPPYQEKTGGGSTTESAMPIYNKFIDKAMALNPDYISMIIPSRWMSGGHLILDSMRYKIVSEKHLSKVFNYDKSTDIFKGVGIAGGVQYFLIDNTNTFDKVEFHNGKVVNNEIHANDDVAIRSLSDYRYVNAHGKEQYLVVRDNKSAYIVEKVVKVAKEHNMKMFNQLVLPRMPFGLESNYEGSAVLTEDYNIKVACSHGRETYANIEDITSNHGLIGKYKVCVCKVSSDSGAGAYYDDGYTVIADPFVLKPNEICSSTYLVLSSHNDVKEANNVAEYIKTKFARFLIRTTISGINMTSRNYLFVPYEDFTRTWTDEELYKKYELSSEDIDYIESTIKPMD